MRAVLQHRFNPLVDRRNFLAGRNNKNPSPLTGGHRLPSKLILNTICLVSQCHLLIPPPALSPIFYPALFLSVRFRCSPRSAAGETNFTRRSQILRRFFISTFRVALLIEASLAAP